MIVENDSEFSKLETAAGDNDSHITFVEEIVTPKWDKKIKMILLAVLISNASYIVIAPFLPVELAVKGVDVVTVGFIFAAYPIASIITSLFLAKF